jgi:CheY-like chemotaxis protein
VPKTLIAVDDSATMRKVLEITFAGEDLRVVTADGPTNALAKLSEEPVAVVIDTSLDGGDGYGLAKEIRARDPRCAIVIMASRYSPYDAGRGRDAGVDDFIDKPFDTQAFIDKVKKAIVARETAKIPVAAAAAPTAPAAAPPANPLIPPFAATPRPAITGAAGTRPVFPTQRTHTLSFEGSPVPPGGPPPAHAAPPLSRTAPSGMPVFQPPSPIAPPVAPPVAAPVAPPVPPPAAAPAPAPAPPVVIARPPAAPVVVTPTASAAAHQAPTAPPRAVDTAPIAAAANGHLAGKLSDLGLSSVQVEAVLALSREVVERVVWEVVPQLAETIIKEELARLTKED